MRDRGMNLNTDTGDKMTDRTATTFTDNILRRSTSSAECSEVQSTNQRPPKELGSKSATNQLQYYNGKVIALCMQHLEHWNRYKVVQASLTRIYYGFLTFGTQRAQLVHLTYLTWPRPCFDRPQFRLFCVCVQRSENKRSKNFPKWYLWASKNKKQKTQDFLPTTLDWLFQGEIQANTQPLTMSTSQRGQRTLYACAKIVHCAIIRNGRRTQCCKEQGWSSCTFNTMSNKSGKWCKKSSSEKFLFD